MHQATYFFLTFCALLVGAAMNNMSTNRIVGGKPTTIDVIPYQVSLQIPHSGHICGGAIISQYWVLTAAHCTDDLQSALIVKVGTTYWDYGGQVRYAAKIIQYPHYNSNFIAYDIALIMVFPPFELNYYTQPVALQDTELPIGTYACVTGWGAHFEGGSIVPQLHQTVVPIVSNWDCQQVYGNIIDSLQICAGYTQGGMDSCKGDSGGPMVVNGRLVGIVSFGFGCAIPNVPGVYTKVSSYRNWIRMHTGI